MRPVFSCRDSGHNRVGNHNDGDRAAEADDFSPRGILVRIRQDEPIGVRVHESGGSRAAWQDHRHVDDIDERDADKHRVRTGSLNKRSDNRDEHGAKRNVVADVRENAGDEDDDEQEYVRALAGEDGSEHRCRTSP